MAQRIVVVKNPGVGDLRGDARDSFLQPFKHFHIKCSVDCPSGWYKLLMDNTFRVKKTMSIDFIFDLLIRAFFGRGDSVVCHSKLCLLVSGSYSKTHLSSPVITCFKKSGSPVTRSKNSREIETRFSFCSSKPWEPNWPKLSASAILS